MVSLVTTFYMCQADPDIVMGFEMLSIRSLVSVTQNNWHLNNKGQLPDMIMVTG